MAEKNMNAKISVEFEETANRQQLSSGDNLPTLFGKTKKFFSDLKPVALTGSYNDLTDTPESSTPVLNTANGNPITITDGADAPLIELGVYGESTQGYATSGGTPLGKNLLQILPTYNIEYNGVTVTSKVDNNGLWYIEIKGTSPSDYIDFRPFGGSSATKSLNLPDGDYILSGVQPNSGVRLVALCKDDQAPKVDTGGGVTFTQNSTNDHYYIRLDVIQSGEINTVVYPMLRSASITDDTYEPYYSNPNPDCPVDVVSVGDDGAVDIVLHGKNLFPYNDLTKGSFWGFYSQLTATTNELTAILTGNSASGIGLTQSAVAAALTGYENKQINFSCEIYADVAMNVSLGNDNDNILVNIPEKTWVKRSWSGIAKVQPMRIYAMPAINGATLRVQNIQIELGNKATSYEPYKGNTATITSGLPLCSVNGVRDELVYNADGTGKIIKRTAKKRLVADGTLHHNGEWQAGGWGINDFFTNGVEISSFVAVANYYCNYATFNTGAHYIVSTAGLIGVAQGGGKNLYFRFSAEHTTSEAVTNYLNANEVYIVYELASPKEIELSAAEMAALMELQTFDGVTNIYNDENADLYIKYWCDNNINTLLNAKAPLIHTHTVSDIVDFPETPDTSNLVSKSGDAMKGILIAQSNTDYTIAQVRNVTMSTEAASGGSNGQIHYQYE